MKGQRVALVLPEELVEILVDLVLWSSRLMSIACFWSRRFSSDPCFGSPRFVSALIIKVNIATAAVDATDTTGTSSVMLTALRVHSRCVRPARAHILPTIRYGIGDVS